jgi:DnaA family protein
LNSAEILRSLESFSLICLDDIDEILGDEKWELAMFHLMNSVKDGAARLIVSASVPAAKLNCNLPDLDSRLKAAVAVETGTPGDEEKLIMLKKRANNRGFELNNEVARFILGRAPRDMRHLMALLERLEVETLRQQKVVTIPFVKKTLQL